jgi:hypothetical protein
MGRKPTKTSKAAAAAAIPAGVAPPGAAAEIIEPLTPRLSLQIDLLRSIRYHEDREWFFAWIHRTAMAVVVIFGTAAFASAAPKLILITTVAGIIDLVWDVSGKARQHSVLRRRLYEIMAETEMETAKLTRLRAQMIRVFADEPPNMHAVNMLAYNGAMEAYDRPKDERFKINWWRRLWRHVHPFSAAKFKTYATLRREAAAKKS